MIFERIQYRKTNGDDVSFFRDSDADGYGDSKATPVKTIRNKQPNGYVGNNSDCNDNDSNTNPETLWYKDADGDGYGNRDITIKSCLKPNGYVSNKNDCYDNNPNAFPGQGKYFAKDRGDGSFDYNCDGAVTVRWTSIGACNGDTPSPHGWQGNVPKAGQTHNWLVDCDERVQGLFLPKLIVVAEFEPKVQEAK